MLADKFIFKSFTLCSLYSVLTSKSVEINLYKFSRHCPEIVRILLAELLRHCPALNTFYISRKLLSYHLS